MLLLTKDLRTDLRQAAAIMDRTWLMPAVQGDQAGMPDPRPDASQMINVPQTDET